MPLLLVWSGQPSVGNVADVPYLHALIRVEQHLHQRRSWCVVLVWKPDESASSCFICSGNYTWPNSRSDRSPCDLVSNQPVTVSMIWGRFDMVTDRVTVSCVQIWVKCVDWYWLFGCSDWSNIKFGRDTSNGAITLLTNTLSACYCGSLANVSQIWANIYNRLVIQWEK